MLSISFRASSLETLCSKAYASASPSSSFCFSSSDFVASFSLRSSALRAFWVLSSSSSLALSMRSSSSCFSEISLAFLRSDFLTFCSSVRSLSSFSKSSASVMPSFFSSAFSFLGSSFCSPSFFSDSLASSGSNSSPSFRLPSAISWVRLSSSICSYGVGSLFCSSD